MATTDFRSGGTEAGADTTAALALECSSQPLDISLHPTNPFLLAAALVDGTVEVHDFQDQAAKAVGLDDGAVAFDGDDDDDDTLVSSTHVHSQWLPSLDKQLSTKRASCRSVLFSLNGTSLWTAGSGGDVACLDAATVGTFVVPGSSEAVAASNTTTTWRIPNASYGKAPIQVLHELPNQLFCTGDEAGGVRVWDPRMLDNSSSSSNHGTTTHAGEPHRRRPVGCVASWKEHEDYVSALEHNTEDNGNTLLATSADGTLSVYDIRMSAANPQPSPPPAQNGQGNAPGVVRRSDPQEDELLSLRIMKNGKKVVCGTSEGVLSVFSYGTWGDVSDRFPGHPMSVETLVKMDEDTLLTGSSDGFIRVVSIQPDKFIGILGDNHNGLPIERLQFNSNRDFVASVTHDNYVRLWDARILRDDFCGTTTNGSSNTNESTTASVNMTASETTTARVEAVQQNNDEDDWEDMDDDGSDDDSEMEDASDSGSDMDETRASQLQGRLKTDNERFFSDL